MNPAMMNPDMMKAAQDMMNSCFFGHYIAFVRKVDKWFCLDDDEVSEVRWEQVAAQKAQRLAQSVPSALRDDSAPSARLVASGAQLAPTHSQSASSVAGKRVEASSGRPHRPLPK